MSYRSLKLMVLALALTVPVGAAKASDPNYANRHLIVSAGELAGLIEAERNTTSKGSAGQLRVVDTRPREKFRKGHLPGAVNIPFTAMTDPQAHVSGALKPNTALAELFAEAGIDSRSRVVIYDDQGGFRASRLFWVLEYFGHRKVSLLDGGIQAWIAAQQGLEMPKGGSMADAAGSGKSSAMAFAVNLTPRRYASADYILERRRDTNTKVIDVRPVSAFAKGHIPWAESMPWKGNLTADGMMKSAADLAARYKAAGITPDMNVVIHCQTGEASAHTYFALRLIGYPQVRTYHRSWAEWGASDDLPKAGTDAG